jgi:4-amino-4-deoxy-L-arabinose transferase-like glycosyltransferase
MPVFADEAIYINWAQMITNDPKQFLFLPLYDGKTPLFIWLLIPFVGFFDVDPLWWGRLVSVLSGMLLLFSIWLITQSVSRSRSAGLIAVGLGLIIPFTLFYSRMALIDTLLSAWLGLSFWALLKWRSNNYSGKSILLSGLFWGLGLITKTSAFYYLPVVAGLFAYDLIARPGSRKMRIIWKLWASYAVGLVLLLWMMFSPLFPFLFQRSSDFAFSPREILSEPLRILLMNASRMGSWLFVYLTPGLVAVLGYVFWHLVNNRKLDSFIRKSGLLMFSALLFLLPFVISGKLLTSRYFLPVVVWFIPVFAIVIDHMRQSSKILLILTVSLFIGFSLRFAMPVLFNPNAIPFPHEDVVQYLTEWSSGHGITEVRDYVTNQAKQNKVIVYTEGYFGTLPDGLSIYFHRSHLRKSLEIHGVGQPIGEIDEKFLQKSLDANVFLVVNQHRFLVDPLPKSVSLVAEYPRPFGGPSLMLYQIKAVE